MLTKLDILLLMNILLTQFWTFFGIFFYLRKIGRNGGGEVIRQKTFFFYCQRYRRGPCVFDIGFPSELTGSIKVIVQTFHLEASRFDAEMFITFSC